MQPKTVASGVSIGLVVAGVYILLDVVHRSDLSTEAASSASAEAATTSSPSHSAIAATSAAPAVSATTSATATTKAASSAAPSASAAPAASAAAESSRAGMTRIPGAKYKPTFLLHEVDVNAFWLDTTETTQKVYAACVQAGVCTATSWARAGAPLDPKAEKLPATEVTWADARAACGFAKKRLPTEIEWELAARGTESRRYPWGETAPADQLCWHGSNGPCEVGSFPASDTPLGVKDMGGGVWEWTADERFCKDPEHPDTCDPLRHPARGGAWNTFTAQILENTFRNAMSAPTNYLGFRCAAD